MMRGLAGMGGGSMIRAAGRAVGAGVGAVQEAVSMADGATGGHGGKPAQVFLVSSSSPTTSTSSGFSSSHPASSTERAGWQDINACFCDVDGWVPVGEEESEEATEYRFADRSVFGPVPSRDEVADAISTIQQIFVPVNFSQDSKDQVSSTHKAMITDFIHRVPYSESESDWIEPAFQLCSSKSFQSQSCGKVIDAFCLLQTNPSIKGTVHSLSSDKAVWDAVMKNEAVQELRESFSAAEHCRTCNSSEDHNAPARILKIFHSTKANIMQLVGKIAKVVSELLSLPKKGKKVDLFEDALRSSFMLSVFVFMVVIITRVQKA